LKETQTVQSVEISTIAHATDDLEKVQSALTNLLPETIKGREIFTRRYLQGHYGNPITTFEARLSEPPLVNEFMECLRKLLQLVDRLEIVDELDRHIDQDGNLFIRIDKQKMFRGIAKLGQDDPIRIRMKFSKFAGKPTVLMKTYLESQ
jgi:RNA binding exosome subunit